MAGSISRRLAACGIFVTLAAVTLSQSPTASASVRSRNITKAGIVLFVAGFNPLASDNCDGSGYMNNGFGLMIPQMRHDGFTGSLITVGYYSADRNCAVDLHHYGHYRDGDPFTRIGRAFSWYVYNTFTKPGHAVDAVGYSMGGLVIRAAIYGASIGAKGYSPPIRIDHVATLGAPNDGAAWYTKACVVTGWTQCAAMVHGSAQLKWLNGDRDPQGVAGTQWVPFGSLDDDEVPAASATSLKLPISQKIVFENVSHSGFIHPDYMDAWSVVNLVSDSFRTAPRAILSGVRSASCVSDREGKTSLHNPIILHDCNGDVSQEWLHDLGRKKSSFSILGMCMDDTASSDATGTNIELFRCNNTAAQQFTPASANALRIFGKCVADPSRTAVSGTQLDLNACDGTKAEAWIMP